MQTYPSIPITPMLIACISGFNAATIFLYVGLNRQGYTVDGLVSANSQSRLMDPSF